MLGQRVLTKNIYIFEKGEAIRLKISEWLNIAGIELDKPFNEQTRWMGHYGF
jgi:hypothetical protein